MPRASRAPRNREDSGSPTSRPAKTGGNKAGSERDLIERCLTQDPSAWDEFVETFSDYIFSVVVHALRRTQVQFSREDAEDIYADVFLTLVERDFHLLRHFEWRCTLKTWLWAVTRKRVSRYYRKKGIKTLPISVGRDDDAFDQVPPSEDPTPLERVQFQETREVLDESMEGLSERDRLCLSLFFFEGLSYKEIANAIGTPANQVGILVFRAKKRLAKKLYGKDL